MSEITVETALQEMERRLNRVRPPWCNEPEVHDQFDDMINGLDQTQAVLTLEDDTQTVAAARIALAACRHLDMCASVAALYPFPGWQERLEPVLSRMADGELGARGDARHRHALVNNLPAYAASDKRTEHALCEQVATTGRTALLATGGWWRAYAHSEPAFLLGAVGHDAVLAAYKAARVRGSDPLQATTSEFAAIGHTLGATALSPV
jgi:hypothetical protein